MTDDWVEGETSPHEYQLLAGGTPEVLTGLTVELVLTRADETAVTTSGDVAIVDADQGTVRYTPDADDLRASDSPLRARFRVSDNQVPPNVKFFPSAVGDVWTVRRP